MLLENKNAVIYGAGGSIGGAVAKAFAREGAKVFLTGRTQASLDIVAKAIIDEDGFAETAIVDALDEKSINNFIDNVVKKTGSIDISFNAIGLEDVQGIPLVDMFLEDFMRPIMISMKTQLLTAKAAGRYMIQQGSGVILSITATPAAKMYPLVGGFGPACSAIEGLARNLASELGPHGIRVVCIRSAGSPDSAVFIKALAGERSLATTVFKDLIDDTMLRKLPILAEIGNVAAFIVSDKASAMTGTVANVTCGTTMD
jgi:NAD(P)-dependent dehydrogenase (short-subunit alcohol dehydrogenase family)